MKKYVVITRFDDETNDKLSSLRTLLHEKGYMKDISPYPPVSGISKV
jgi:hypothetical protein